MGGTACEFLLDRRKLCSIQSLLVRYQKFEAPGLSIIHIQVVRIRPGNYPIPGNYPLHIILIPTQ
jgi:hypothetical protein